MSRERDWRYMDSDSREQLTEAYFRAMDEEQFETFEDVLTSDVSYRTDGMELEGSDEVREVFESGQFSNATHEVRRRVHGEDVSICFGNYSADVSGSGHVEGAFADAFEFDEETEKIERITIYTREP